MAGDMSDALKDRRLIFILRLGISAHVVEMVQTIWSAGGAFVEITLNTPSALDAISSLKGLIPEGCYLGAGTVLSSGDAERASDAGAGFVVSPIASQELVSTVRNLGMMGVIGASTPTEIFDAHRWGADFVKVFPAQSADYIRAVRAPMSNIPLVAVGGITRENAIKYLKVGCSAVGVGGSLLPVEPDGTFDAAELEACVRTMTRVCSLTST